jgi:hypothetical protein
VVDGQTPAGCAAHGARADLPSPKHLGCCDALLGGAPGGEGVFLAVVGAAGVAGDGVFESLPGDVGDFIVPCRVKTDRSCRGDGRQRPSTSSASTVSEVSVMECPRRARRSHAVRAPHDDLCSAEALPARALH